MWNGEKNHGECERWNGEKNDMDDESDEDDKEGLIQSSLDKLTERLSSAAVGKNKDLKKMYTMKKYLEVKKEESDQSDGVCKNTPKKALINTPKRKGRKA